MRTHEEGCWLSDDHDDWCCWCPSETPAGWTEACERCKGYPPPGMEEADDCDLCVGTGIGQFGDPDTSKCWKCRGRGVLVRRGEE